MIAVLLSFSWPDRVSAMDGSEYKIAPGDFVSLFNKL